MARAGKIRRREKQERAPEDRFRQSIERTGRPLKVQVAWLLRTFEHAELNPETRASIERRLTQAGFRVSPPLEEADPLGTVTLYLVQPEEVVRRAIERTGRPLKVQMAWLLDAFGDAETPVGIERRLKEAGFRVSPSLEAADAQGTAMLSLAKPDEAAHPEASRAVHDRDEAREPDIAGSAEPAEGGSDGEGQTDAVGGAEPEAGERAQPIEPDPHVAKLERLVSELEQSLAEARARAGHEQAGAQNRIAELERELESREAIDRPMPAERASAAAESSGAPGDPERPALDTFGEAKRAASEARAAIERIQVGARSRMAELDRRFESNPPAQEPADGS